MFSGYVLRGAFVFCFALFPVTFNPQVSLQNLSTSLKKIWVFIPQVKYSSRHRINAAKFSF